MTIRNKRLIYTLLVSSLLLLILWAYKAHRQTTVEQESSAYLLQMFNTGDQIRLGNPQSRKTITLFYDYSCPICRRFFNYTLAHLQNDIKSSHVSIILKPINPSGDQARSEAYNMLYCLYHWDLFNDLHEILLMNPNYMYHPDFLIFKEAIYREQPDIQTCIESHMNSKNIENNMQLLKKLGFNSLPVFVINNKTYKGLLSPEKIKRLIK